LTPLFFNVKKTTTLFADLRRPLSMKHYTFVCIKENCGGGQGEKGREWTKF